MGQFRIFPRFTDINGYPTPARKELRPAMIAVDHTFVFLRRNCGADCEKRRNADTTRQRDKVGVEVGALTGPCVASKHRVTATPAGARFVVAHLPEHVIVMRSSTFDIVRFSQGSLFGD